MISEQRMLNILQKPIFSKKSIMLKKKNNVLVFKVSKNSKKLEIKSSVEKIFNFKVIKVQTLIVKGKKKKYKNKIGYRSDWKKAYVFIKQNNRLNNFNKFYLGFIDKK